MASHISPSKMETKASSSTAQDFIDYGDVCRICGSDENSLNLIGIYSNEGLGDDLPTKINTYLPVTVASTDDLPLQCCTKCVSTLNSWHVFVNNSVEADSKWKNFHVLASSSNKLLNEEEGDDGIGDRDDDQSELDDDMPLSELVETKQEPEDDDEYGSANLEAFDPLLPNLNTYSFRNTIQRKLSESTVLYLPLEPDESNNLDTSNTSSPKKEVQNVKHCPLCNKRFKTQKPMLEHFKIAHPHDSVAFDHMGYVLKRKKRVAQSPSANSRGQVVAQEVLDAAQVIIDGRTFYQCQECSKTLHSRYTFAKHIRIHTGERPHVCDLCGKQFRVSQGLVRHLRETHEGIKEYGCDLCGRKFSTKRNVDEHRRIHTDERPYVCDTCGKAFRQKASLFVHNRSHSDVYPFKCPHCDAGFRAKAPLNQHITRHTGEKPYPCDMCGRPFRLKYELKRHKLIHYDAKPFTCTICGLTFRQNRYLKKHMRINHSNGGALVPIAPKPPQAAAPTQIFGL